MVLVIQFRQELREIILNMKKKMSASVLITYHHINNIGGSFLYKHIMFRFQLTTGRSANIKAK